MDEIASSESFGEPGVDGGEHVASLPLSVMCAIQSRETESGAQFKGFRAFITGRHQGLPEPTFGGIVVRVQPQKEVAFIWVFAQSQTAYISGSNPVRVLPL